jgi:hypothetical protein
LVSFVSQSPRIGMAATMVELGFTTVDKHVLRFEWPILILVAAEEEPLAKYCFVSVASDP